MRSRTILTGVVEKLRAQAGDAPTDAELLARYVRSCDQAAFAALVERHGGMVFGVARRQSADRQQAEDVVQAVFLALARSAARLGRQPSTANWLYTVARRLARKARARAARRLACEQHLRPADRSDDPLAEISGRELLVLIDEEIARLPEVYRQPILLCCVEGLSRDEAARQLGWSAGALKGRLERGRRRLADRLAARGVPSAAPLLAAPAAFPAALTEATVAAAASPWSSSLPAAVLDLAATRPTPRLLPAVLLGTLLAIGLAGLLLHHPGDRAPDPAPSPPAAAEVAPADDPLPAGAVLRFGTARFRHGTLIESLAVSADGKRGFVNTGFTWVGATRAFDLTDGRALYTVAQPGWRAEAIALSPDGKHLATREDNAVILRDATTGKEVRKIAIPSPGNTRTITYWMTFTPDGTAVAVTPSGSVIHLVDATTGEVRQSFTHEKTVFACAFSPDGKRMAAGGYESDRGSYFVRLWDVESGKELGRLAAGDGIRSLAFAPDGAAIAGGGDDGKLRLWDATTAKELRTLPRIGYRIRGVAFAPDGKTVAAAGDAVHLYDPATGKERVRIEQQARAVAFTGDSATLVGAVGGAVYRWDAATGRTLTPLAADAGVDQILVTPDGRHLLTRGQDQHAHIWDAKKGRHLLRLAVERQGSLALSPDGRLLAWPVEEQNVKFPDPKHPNSTHTGTRVRLYDLTAGRHLDRFPGFKGSANDVLFLPDGRTLLTHDRRDATVRLWDVESGKERRSFQVVRDGETKPYLAERAVLSSDGKTLAVCYQRKDNTSIKFAGVVVRLWDVASGKERHELTGHINTVAAATFSPDGRLLVTCGENAYGKGRKGEHRDLQDRVYVWDADTGRRVAALPEGLPIGAGSAVFAPGGRALATASADGTVRLWEVATWTVRAEFRGHRDRVTSLAFAPDGRLLTGGLDTTVLAWDVRPGGKAEGTLAEAWDALLRADAAGAFRAQGRLLAEPGDAVKWLTGRLALKPADPDRLKKLIAELDSTEFSVREQATGALRDLGSRAAAALREAVKKSDSAEVRRRAGALLDELTASIVPPEELRVLRAVEVLEWIDTPESRRLLREVRGEMK